MLTGIVQSIPVVVLAMLGNMGLGNLLVYILPGIVLELGLLFFPVIFPHIFPHLSDLPHPCSLKK